MRLLKHFPKAPVRVLRIKRQQSRSKLRRAMLEIKFALEQEKQETIEMLATYRNFTQGKASREQLKEANTQFVDILKGVGLGIFAILPFSPLTIPLIIKLGKRVGVDVLPSAFYQKNK